MADPLKRVAEYGRALFGRLDEFFRRATGTSAEQFSSVESFGEVVRQRANELGPRGEAAFRWLDTEIRAFYAQRGVEAFGDATQLGGMKLVLGGSRFRQSQLASVSTSVLYSDTVLIPDPVMPWLERARTEEKFRHVLLLEAVHTLLQLKPLVDADLPYPPVVVFPSWEKLLEDHDAQTQAGISQLVIDTLCSSLGEELSSLDDVRDFVDRHADRFCEAVDQQHLFVAPGGSIDEPLTQALARYDAEMRTWRTPEWLEAYDRLPLHSRVLNGILERITPVYHLLENANEFASHPLMCLEQHAHYFRIVSHTSSTRLQRLGVLNPNTVAMVNALGSRRLRWLGSIPIDTLSRLRRDQENVTFRQRLAAAVGRLEEAALNSVDRVAAEVCHEISAAIGEHEKELRTIQAKYNRLHGQTAVLTTAAAGAALIPALAPLLGGAVPIALAAKYGHDKIAELAEKRRYTRSLIGVLAETKPKS